MNDKSVAYKIEDAFDPAASVFVSANAGAGKTSLLANRVLRLLLHGALPSKILCLTFTNAAAAEMMSRVLGELGRWVMADDAQLRKSLAGLVGDSVTEPLMARARSLFAQVLEAPVGVRIQTIHGFCQSLLRRFPIEAGISPHFTVMDSRTEQEMLQEARLRLFSRAQNEDPELQEALSAIAHSLSESSFQGLLAEIVQHKRRIRSLFHPQHGVESAVDAVWSLLKVKRDLTVTALIETHFAYDEPTLASWRLIVKALMQGSAKEQATAGCLIRWFKNPAQREACMQDYVLAFLTQKGGPRAKLHNKDTITDAGLSALLKAEQERVWRFHDALKALEAAQQTTRLLHIAETLLALYERLKQSRALMDYDDLILTACALLNRPGIAPWVLFKLDGGIDHILVDEAQDTSPEQWQIIDALTQEFFAGEGRNAWERSLFIVGDEKQSIYSFQGADPRALGHMQLYFKKRIEDAAKPVHRISLTRSYRSAVEILSAVDSIFAQDAAKAGLSFEDAPLAHIPTRVTYPGLVEIWPLITPPEDDSETVSTVTRLARRIAETIQQWLRDGVMLEAKGRRVEAGDIMILVRNRTSLVDRLVRALKRRGVPVAGHDRMRLGDNLAVQDLIALGQCLLLPEDDLTLAALLKSPIFGLSEEQLFELAYGREKKSLWEQLSRGNDGAVAEAFALLIDLRAKADFISPFELYSYLLDTRGARSRFTGRMGDEYHDPIDEFLGQALLYERSHTPSLQGFLHWLQSSDSEIKRDMEQAKNSVRIMTIHGAKGLQAPIVILPDTVEPPKMRDSLLWHEGEGRALPFWPMSREGDDALCAGLRDTQQQAMLAEYRRLMYVALTRAEDRLYIYGATAKEKLNEQCWYHLIKTGLTPMATPFETPWGEGFRVGSAPSLRGGIADAAIQPVGPDRAGGEAELPRFARNDDFDFLRQSAPSEPTPSQPLTPSRLAGEEPASASPLKQPGLYQRGNLIHKLLQYLPDSPPGQWDGLARSIAAGYKDLPPQERDDAIREVQAVMRHPECAFLFAAGSLAEVPIAGCVDVGGKSIAVAGQIDRLAIGEVIWIADFKSNRAVPAPIPVPYIRQMKLYQLLLQQIYPGKTVRCALVWTSVPKITVLSDALLDEVPPSSYI